jgi:tyrosine-protein kinase Etk/Wzc
VTNAFIKERMLAIGRELGVVDSEIEGIKKSNQMIDITSEATRSITESSKFKVEGLSIENQISVANYIRDYLDDPSHAGDLIPMVADQQRDRRPDHRI